MKPSDQTFSFYFDSDVSILNSAGMVRNASNPLPSLKWLAYFPRANIFSSF